MPTGRIIRKTEIVEKTKSREKVTNFFFFRLTLKQTNSKERGE